MRFYSLLFLLLSASFSLQAQEIPPTIVNYQVTESATILNNLGKANFSIIVQKKSARDTAQAITELMNKASRSVKTFAHLKIAYSTHSESPLYNDQQHITGWQGSGTLQVESSDLTQLSEAIAQLQEFSQFNGVQYFVDNETQEKVKTDLIARALLKFNAKGESIRSVLKKDKIWITTLNIHENTPHIIQPMGEMMMKSSAIETTEIDQGEQKISVSVQGVIQIQ